MSLDLNISPIYDDYDEAKNFLRVLYNPGRAVQARELTTAQSILQHQITKFATHIFKDGTSVLNARIKINFNKEYFDVDLLDPGASPVDVNNFIGRDITGLTSGAQGIVTHVDATTRSIYYDVKGGEFVDGETIETQGTPPNYQAIITAGTQAQAVIASIESGIVFVGGVFVVVDEQEIIVDGVTNNGNYKVGFLFVEDIVNADTDSSLLDPANGAYNFNAPGADRYRGRAVLTSYETGVDTPADNFVEAVSIDTGAIIRQQLDVQYAQIIELLARRTYDESGNYTIREFPINIEEHPTDSTKLNVGLEPGKAYVLGFERETIATIITTINKARMFSSRNNSALYCDFGPYADILGGSSPSISGMFNIREKEDIELMSGTGGTGTVIGTAKITSFARTGTGGLRAYFSRANTLTGIFTSVRSIRSLANPTTYADIAVDGVTGLPVLQNKPLNVGVFKLREDVVKALALNEANYDVHRSYFNLTRNGSANFVIQAPDNTTDFYTESQGGTIYVVRSDTGARLVSGVDFSTIVNNIGGAKSTLTIDTVDDVSFANIDVIVRMYKSEGNPKTKTLTDTTLNFTTGVGVTTKTLNNVDVFEILSVTKDPSGSPIVIDPTTLTLDTGGRDFYYDYGIVGGLESNTEYDIEYRYFAHSGSGDYFCVNSYDNASNQAVYSDIYSRIPSYTSQDGASSFNLRDCIDFRRSVADLSTGTDMIVPGSTFRSDYDFYIPRYDKVYIDQYGDFGTITGVPNKYPEVPNDIDIAMTLYKLFIPAYTFNPDDIDIELIDNRRYTMRDIGELKDRIEKLEYYTSLNALEKATADMSVVDQAGLEKFKNGIVVDNFSGHGIGDVYNSEYHCSIDPERGILRSPFTVDSLDFEVKDDTPTLLTKNMILHDHIATLKYTTSVIIDQPNASETINVNPYNVFRWVGTMNLNPETDNWIDTVRAPSVTINIQGANDAMKNLANWSGTRWNDWNTIWSGNPRVGPWQALSGAHQSRAPDGVLRQKWGQQLTLDTVQQRTGSRPRVIPGTIERNLGDKVLDTSIIPWMRSKTVNWTVHGMRPNQTLRAKFDGVDVTTFCTGLVTDSAGTASGTFNIPNTDSVKFRVGTKIFRLEDDVSGDRTSAEAKYTASGLLQTKQNTIVSVDNPRVIQERVSETTTRSISTETNVRWYDPLAQSFLIEKEGGAFLSSIDLYFRTKDTSLPVSIMIVENENGTPTQNIVPYSEVTLYPGSINTSIDGLSATNFTFSDPVYLQDDIEYSFIIISNSDQYEVFVSKIGGVDTITNKVISKQPYIGVMFKSQNASTWTPDQERDIKFKINRCVFETSSSGTFDIHNEDQGATVSDITTIMFNIDTMKLNQTNIAWSYQFYGDSFINFEEKINIDLDSQKQIDDITSSPSRSLLARATFSSSNDAISPIINVKRMSAIIVNNTVVDVAETYLDAGAYITRFVTLADPSDDLRVIFDSIKPTGSEVEVYFKTGQFIPRYIPISDAVHSEWIGETKYIYHIDVAETGITLKGSLVVTKVDDTTTPLRLYAKEISDISPIIPPTDWAGASLSATKGVIIVDDGNIDDYQGNWSAGAYTVGEQVYHNGSLWEVISNTSAEPTTGSVDWREIEISIVDDPVLTPITGTAVVEDAEQEWRTMILETATSPNVNTEDNYVEYTYIPEDPIDEEFSSFSVKIELKASSPTEIPFVKNFRSLAVY